VPPQDLVPYAQRVVRVMGAAALLDGSLEMKRYFTSNDPPAREVNLVKLNTY